MSFLQPYLLAALPLISLPVIIHLINQRRYQTMPWAAMMFLLAANRMSRGYARIRQWLILAARVVALAGLLFAISRPLAGGWLGNGLAGKPDTTIVLLDRSPSMQQGAAGAEATKLDTGRRQLIQALQTVGSGRWVLIEGPKHTPKELPDLETLSSADASGTGPTAAAGDILSMLESARDYIKTNKPGRAEIWIVSDVRRNDWNAESARWQAVREGFQAFEQGIKFHLLAYPTTAPENLSIRVTDVRRQKVGEGAELLVSLKVVREGENAGAGRGAFPIQFEINGARSEVTAEMVGPTFELKDHRIPMEKGKDRGWGRVTLPADANLADNAFYFAFDQPAPRRAIVVADDKAAAEALQLAASIAPDPALKCTAEVITPEQLPGVEWDKVSLLLWQAALPEGNDAKLVQAFIERGGDALFFPSRSTAGGEFLGAKWTEWVEKKEDVPVENWRGDQDLLSQTMSGAPLPVGQIQVRRYRGLSGEFTPLATLKGGAPLLARVTTNAGGLYFCTTTPSPGDSSLTTNGIVFYVLVQRALAAGAQALENTRQLVAGEASTPGDDPNRWKRVAGSDESVASEYPIQAGVYDSNGRLLAINRPAAEDNAPILDDDRVAGLFAGLDFSRVDDREGNLGSIIQEIWRLFLILMMVALVAEAALCLPKKVQPAVALTGAHA